MQKTWRAVGLSAIVFFGLIFFGSTGLTAFGQDSPSLGDAARQTRQQKQQQKDAQSKAPTKAGDNNASIKTPKIITNDELPAHIVTKSAHSTDAQAKSAAYSSAQDGDGKVSAEDWKAQILLMKNSVASLQANIDRLNGSIHYAPANCVSNCVQWNEHQEQKQQQVEQMKSQLDDMQKRLEDMQDSARQQGYGSSVYEP
jgi:hypothetical protein